MRSVFSCITDRPQSPTPPSHRSYPAFLSCMYLQDVEHAHEYGVALSLPFLVAAKGNVVAANYTLFFVTYPTVLGQLLKSNLECSREAGY
jgi:hypothetical protein